MKALLASEGSKEVSLEHTSAAEMKPLPSLSKTLNASRNSSSLSWSCNRAEPY